MPTSDSSCARRAESWAKATLASPPRTALQKSQIRALLRLPPMTLVDVIRRELGFPLPGEAGKLFHFLRPESGIDTRGLEETFRRAGTGAKTGGLHAALDLENDFVLAGLAEIGQIEGLGPGRFSGVLLAKARPRWIPSALIISVTEVPSTFCKSGSSVSSASLTEAWRPTPVSSKKLTAFHQTSLPPPKKRQGS